MNGLAQGGLDEGNFGEGNSNSIVKAFDAFPKTKKTYLTTTRNGSTWTVLFACICVWLTTTEINRWLKGTTTHTFSVEKGIAHELQINIDVVVAMQCQDVHVNIQDASGDRIMSDGTIKKDPTLWRMWQHLGRRDSSTPKIPDWVQDQAEQYVHEEDVHDYLSAARGRKKFAKTPRMPRDAQGDACRVYGSIEGNKVQGDFHITARGHGYYELGREHLAHTQFNFSHHVNELSFGPHFPKLVNPLDGTHASTEYHFYKYQYFLSVVPTIYTDTPHRLLTSSPPHIRSRNRADQPDQADLLAQSNKDFYKYNPFAFAPHTIYTNQYAVTEQSHVIGEHAIPGVFVKYDIEPIMLTVAEEWGGSIGMLVRCVNVVAGVLVAGSWIVALVDWAGESFKARRGRRATTDSGLIGEKREL